MKHFALKFKLFSEDLSTRILKKSNQNSFPFAPNFFQLSLQIEESKPHEEKGKGFHDVH